ncbi:MAG: Fpg/Nei family DNA glycosylase [Actinomycetota bacterium]|nr:Fpg/Nei family DNA glycosylase [Actinomycetota bacterium]
MPELPDVEGFKRTFDRTAAGKRVRRVSADPTIMRNANPQALGRALSRRRFSNSDRHGKWLLCRTDGPILLLHFGMTGGLSWSDDDTDRHIHDRLILELDDGELRYRNMRKLGGVWLAHDDTEVASILGPLGPDALRLKRDDLADRLKVRRGRIKSALMNQRVLAGLGNLTVDESLWRAHINPERPVNSISDDEMKALHASIQQVLRDSTRVGYVPGRRTWLTGARRKEATCPRCRSRLDRKTIAGRTTYFCPSCQPFRVST